VVTTSSLYVCSDERLAEFCHDCLSVEERERAERYTSIEDTNRFVLSRSLLNYALRQHLPGASPASLQIATTDKGKPYLKAPFDRVAISISHTPGLVAVCISDANTCGVDLESLDRVMGVEGLSARYLSLAEQEWLQAHKPAERRHAFLKLWTLKEAYLKALGLGISVPLSALTFSWGESIRLECAEPSMQALDHWVFDQRILPSGHLLAVAQEGPCSELELIEVTLGDDGFSAKH